MELVPEALESARTELTWKYFTPAPAKAVRAWLVAKSSLPLTASVLVALSLPAATFVIVRSEPTAPTLTVLAGVVPAKV